MKSRAQVILALLVLALVSTAALAKAERRPSRPNVIVVLVDDLGYADFSCYGNTGTKTENIDRLASEGLRFTQFYVNSPICSPSRTALTTGQYPARWRITSYIDNRALNQRRGMAQFLDPQAPTLARVLSGAGYATGHFGKWHMGGGRDVGEAPLITEYGFDASLTQFEGLGDRVLALLDTHDGTPAPKMPLGVASEKLGRGKVTWTDRCQVTKAFVDRTLEFIRQAEADGKPFYVNVWPDDVHSPFFPPRELRGDGSKRALYEGVLATMDAQLGPLFDYVRQNPKLRDNTLILVASDNGPEQGAGSAGPFRGTKAALYEGGIREPLIAWGPGLIPAARRGTRDETTVLSGVDLVPSLLRLAGVKAPEGVIFDGLDRSAALRGKAGGARPKPLFWKRPPDRPGPPEDRWPDLAIRDGAWKLLVQEDGSRPQLYNLAGDPGESRNVAEKHPQRVERLRSIVLAWNATLPKQGSLIIPDRLQEAREMSDREGISLETILMEQFHVEPFKILQAVAFMQNMRAVDLEQHPPAPSAIALVPAEVARRCQAVPVAVLPRTGDTPEMLVVAVADPAPVEALDDVRATCGMRIRPVLVSAEQLTAALERHYGPEPE